MASMILIGTSRCIEEHQNSIWVSDGIVGLDLSGEMTDGRRRRWVGAPVAQAIEYENVSLEAADYFDRIIETMCSPSFDPKH